MRTFTFTVNDDRFDVPFIAEVTCSGPLRARQIAEQKLSESPHIQWIEVTDGVETFRVAD